MVGCDDNQKVKVSIGLPVYNGESFINNSINSILSQNFSDFELIISDNASTDNTWDIITSYAARDKRISLYRQPQNIGGLKNFEFVLHKARGSYFMWAAVDDWWAPEFLANMVNELDNNVNSAVAMSAVERVTEEGKHVDFIKHEGNANPANMSNLRLAMKLMSGCLYHIYIYGLYRTCFLKKALQNFPLVMGGDRLFVCQVALATKFSYVNQILHIRTVNSVPLAKRYAQEELGRIWQDPLRQFKVIYAAGPYLFNSQVIPLNRKMWVPLLVIIYTSNVLFRYLINYYFSFKHFLIKFK
jgi:glycosyltransferase involved in cell wall biosynthesis